MTEDSNGGLSFIAPVKKETENGSEVK